jgi:diguanylate cyclase (GGDEF)-like protein
MGTLNKKPLNRSVTVGSTIFLVLLSLILSIATYQGFRQSIYRRYEAQMSDILYYTDSHIDHDDLAQCVRTGVKSEKYEQLQALVDDLYTNHQGLHYIYVVASTKTEEGEPGLMEVVTGLAPEDYAIGEGEEFTLGADLTDQYDSTTLLRFQRISQGGQLAYFQETWDGVMDYTGVLPLKDSSGEIFAMLCVDITVNGIQRTLFQHTLLHLILIVVLGIMFIYLFLRWMSYNVIRPIEALEHSVVSFAKVSHDQRDPTLLEYHPPVIRTQNEVESLSDAVTRMSNDLKNYAVSMMRAETEVENMQSQMDRIGLIAYQDSLTKVKNKAAYMKTKNMLNRNILTCTAKFGIVMIDLNSLKRMNDTYGHKHGDSYIMACAKLICDVFTYSPVFRIGGDEFVVVLEGRDYDNRDTLVNRLTNKFNQLSSDESLPPWERLSAAIGAAVYTENDHTVDAVFKRADERMYANKIAMKGGRDS